MPTNALIHEKSPYLLQHAHNPVAWLPWGEEAFRKAREEDKPIFLSVGYSTCHWCHVMERESFEREEIAELLNRHFVPVKVDREERPDIDRVYMLFVQATTGAGGWPMSVWLTPERKPFFGGTYFPPEARYGQLGFRQVLERIAEAWRAERPSIVQSSADVLEQLRRHTEGSAGGVLGRGLSESAYSLFRRDFDPRFAGFGGAPKFPRIAVHNFLLRYYARTGKVEATEMVFATLNQMARGGIHDQLGGGFHRYAVDAHWMAPHFEKMLYDQAQIAVSYLEACQVIHDPFYAEAARGTLEYVLREMTDSGGAFYSAEDADSVVDPARPEVKEEGAFYLWTKQEIDVGLEPPAREWFEWQYGVEEGGNLANHAPQEFAGKNILHLAHLEDETARQFGRPQEEIHRAMEEARHTLLEARAGRVRPHLDDKILTAWNGLMISAFARGAQVLGDARYLEAARAAAGFILERMYDGTSGRLRRRFRDGEAAIGGFLDDYAFFVQGLLDLYEAGFEVEHLETAIRLTRTMVAEFEDRTAGGFFSTAAGDGSAVLRLKDDYDGAEPSGNSIAILNLLRLGQITGGQAYRELAERALGAFAGRMTAAPGGLPQMFAALEYLEARPKQIVIAGRRGAADTEALLGEVNRRFLPSKALLLVEEESRAALARHAPQIEAMRMENGSATAYVCENFACQLPASDAAQLGRLLDQAG
jgi:uncharacterized protein YyaL (SSP411 family)